MARYIKKNVDLSTIQEFVLEGDHFWAVPSASDATKVYEVRKPADKYTCNCMDYMTRHIGKGTECKHGISVRTLEQLKVRAA